MHKLDLFKEVLKSETYLSVPWVISAFSLIQEAPDEWKLDPYPYRIVQTPIGHMYVDPVYGELKPIEGTQAGLPVFRANDRIVLQPGDIENVKEETVTSVGTAYFNKAALGSVFGAKIPYQQDRVDGGKIEEMINDLFVDNPKDGAPRDPGSIYPDEVQAFANTVFDMTNFAQLFTWGLTEKALMAPPGVEEKKKELIEANKDRLWDPAVVAAIEKELVKFDAEFLKDDPSMNFLLSKKSREIVRKKLYLDYGAERNLTGSQRVDFIPNSLSQGWQIEKFPSMNDALRAGSFDRGSETQLGGVAFKEILRATSNISISVEDCGSTVGREIFVDKDSLKHIKGYSIITEQGPKFIKTMAEAGQYMGTEFRPRRATTISLPEPPALNAGSRPSVRYRISTCLTALVKPLLSALYRLFRLTHSVGLSCEACSCFLASSRASRAADFLVILVLHGGIG